MTENNEEQATEKKEATVGGVPISKVATLGGGGIGFIGLILFVHSLSNRVDKMTEEIVVMSAALTTIKAELIAISPRSLRDELRALEKEVLTKRDLDLIAPWKLDKPGWEAWRTTVDRRLEKLEHK